MFYMLVYHKAVSLYKRKPYHLSMNFGPFTLQILSWQLAHFKVALEPSQNRSGCFSNVISHRSITIRLVKNKLQVKKFRIKSSGVHIMK